ncbi:acyl-CoA dehydrogenase family protein [Nocardioides sp.]|uniref:acyl-CoA dehydrogenase family protein n=1 Tax=Nocardioides sp. TaxID=35761 RepID=UPI0026384841|nr:acyl-CoA dehydrogenase family protein [Nocardioides sp.]MDI6912478.1 acyl-CoA dehydrogenase family protein [Nocardioides sp.]
MPTSPTPDQASLRQAVRGFVQRYAPLDVVAQWDDDAYYPAEFFQRFAEHGYMALPFSTVYGGDGAGAVEMAIIGEELGRHGLDIAAGFGLTVFMAMNIERHGSEEQKRYFLPRVFSGETRFAISMTEPDAGSDAAAIRLTATPKGSGYVLNGQKMFTTGAGIPNTVLHVTAVTDSGAPKRSNMSVILVPNDAQGVEIRRLRTVGRHILGTYEVFYDNVYVDSDQVLGELDQGWSVLHSSLELERLFSCAAMVGAAQQVQKMTTDYVTERQQFGRPIGTFQAVSHQIADMHCAVESARLLTYDAARSMDQESTDTFRKAAVAKLVASEALQNATNTGMQLMGGYGYMLEFQMQRFWREARIITVTAGTSEIQRSIIARELGLGAPSRVPQPEKSPMPSRPTPTIPPGGGMPSQEHRVDDNKEART